MDRRSFLKLGMASSATLTAVGVTAALSGCSEALPKDGDWKVLTAQDRTLLSAIAPVMLKGSFPTDQADQQTEIENFLNKWRYSSLGLLNLGYNGINQLITAAWFGQKETWQQIGYPGPPHASILITK